MFLYQAILKGEPHVKDAKVTVMVTKQDKEKKIRVFKKKRRQGYRRTIGHRQEYTELFVKAIMSPDGETVSAEPKKAKEKTTLIRLYEIIYVGLLMLWSKKGKPPLKNAIYEFISRKEYEEDLSSGKLFDKLIREIKETPYEDKSGYYIENAA